MLRIDPKALIPMDLFAGEMPLRIALDYARPDNLLFGEVIYRENVRLWLHEDMAQIVLLAAQLCFDKHRCSFVLHDGLRSIDAQDRMLETKRVKDNPQWLEEPRLLSSPGAGAHPRGMAIDISLETRSGEALDMGSAFDFLATSPTSQHNPAHRHYKHKDAILENRAKLDKAMVEAALRLNRPIQLLPQEWWDFRLKPETYNQFAPLSDSDLPPQMQMVGGPSTIPDFDDEHFALLKGKLLGQVHNAA